MESSLLSSSVDSTPSSLSSWNHLSIFLFRPLLAFSLVLFILLLGWWLAWKLLLVHVPLVQEIFGLRKKPVRPKRATRHRFSRFYNSLSIRDQPSSFTSHCQLPLTGKQ